MTFLGCSAHLSLKNGVGIRSLDGRRPPVSGTAWPQFLHFSITFVQKLSVVLPLQQFSGEYTVPDSFLHGSPWISYRYVAPPPELRRRCERADRHCLWENPVHARIKMVRRKHVESIRCLVRNKTDDFSTRIASLLYQPNSVKSVRRYSYRFMHG